MTQPIASTSSEPAQQAEDAARATHAMPPPLPAEALAHVLAVPRCVGCGYLLRGLPEGVRRCPECGWSWCEQTIVLLGQPPGDAVRTPVMRVSPKQFGLAVAVLGGSIIWTMLFVGGWKFAGLVAPPIILLVALGSWGMAMQAKRRQRQWLLIRPEGVDSDRKWREPAPVPWDLAEVTAKYEDAPPPGWVVLYLKKLGKRRTRAKRLLRRKLEAYSLHGEATDGVETECDPDRAGDVLRRIFEYCESHEGTFRATVELQTRFGLFPAQEVWPTGDEGDQSLDEYEDVT